MVFDSYRTSPLTFGVHCPPCQSSRIQLREKTHLNFCSFTKFYCIDNQGNWNTSSFSLFPSYCTYPSRPLWPNYSSLITDRHLHLHFHTDHCPPSCSPTKSANITQIFLLKCTFPNKNNFVPKWWILWSKVIPKYVLFVSLMFLLIGVNKDLHIPKSQTNLLLYVCLSRLCGMEQHAYFVFLSTPNFIITFKAISAPVSLTSFSCEFLFTFQKKKKQQSWGC